MKCLSGALLVVGLLVPARALAADAPDDGTADPVAWAAKHPFFVGASIGAGYANVEHPELATHKMLGPVLAIHAGYAFSPKWSTSLELTNFEQTVTRDGPGQLFSSTNSWIHLQGDCNKCMTEPGGGWLKDAVLLLTTVGQRIDYSPFGLEGPYLGATGGVAFLSGLDARTGMMGTARAGVRLRPIAVLAVALEGGFQGQAYSDSSAVLGYATIQGRAHF